MCCTAMERLPKVWEQLRHLAEMAQRAILFYLLDRSLDVNRTHSTTLSYGVPTFKEPLRKGRGLGWGALHRNIETLTQVRREKIRQKWLSILTACASLLSPYPASASTPTLSLSNGGCQVSFCDGWLTGKRERSS